MHPPSGSAKQGRENNLSRESRAEFAGTDRMKKERLGNRVCGLKEVLRKDLMKRECERAWFVWSGSW